MRRSNPGGGGLDKVYASPDSKQLIDPVAAGSAPPAAPGVPPIPFRQMLNTIGNRAGDVAAAALRYVGFGLTPNGQATLQPRPSIANELLALEQEKALCRSQLQHAFSTLRVEQQQAADAVGAAQARVVAAQEQAQHDVGAAQLRAVAAEERAQHAVALQKRIEELEDQLRSSARPGVKAAETAKARAQEDAASLQQRVDELQYDREARIGENRTKQLHLLDANRKAERRGELLIFPWYGRRGEGGLLL